MDQEPLVAERIDAGARFVARFNQTVSVKAAFWLKAQEDALWYLYVASDEVNDTNHEPAYREVLRVAQELHDPNFDPFRVKLIHPNHQVVRAVVELQECQAGRLPTRLHAVWLGETHVEEAYLYPPPVRPLTRLMGPGVEERKLKAAVEQAPWPEDLLRLPQEETYLDRIVASGVDPEQAKYVVRQALTTRLPQPAKRPPIPSGTVVKSKVVGWWGDRPEDDPNPLLMVEGPNGERGFVHKSETENV